SDLYLLWADATPTRAEETFRRGRALAYRERAAATATATASASASASGPGRGDRAGAGAGRGTRDAGRGTRGAVGGADGARRGRESVAPVPEPDGDRARLRDAVASLLHASSVTFDDIGGLEAAKDELRFTLALALAARPDGVRLPLARNILLHGPPGTGKTLLAAATSSLLSRAVSRERAPAGGAGRGARDAGGGAFFFNVKVSSVLSKYFGESSRIVSELYGCARDASPSVIFFDEFESLAPSRDGEPSGAERRLLSTILSELDGLSEKGRGDLYVFTIAATNRPWDLDAAALSRFHKRLYVPPPAAPARRAILEVLLPRRGFATEFDLDRLVERTEGFSGRDLERVAGEAVADLLRDENRDLPALLQAAPETLSTRTVRLRPLRWIEAEAALARCPRPMMPPALLARYEEFR
ncbi:MAG: ATP-binding protein, partial [Planctomycetes bacterium]|nr:ATP-binding protein [Planctomycetota bacterium]